VDTRGDREQGAELADAVRAVTRLPLAVVVTHAHFDHCFGTEAFRPTLVYAQRGCGPALRDTTEAQRAEWTAYYRRHDRPDIARALAATQVVPPSVPVDGSATVDLGGRVIRLLHPGLGHTDHDLVALVPDAGVLFAGDLVEQGAPPDFTDAHPASWPMALDGLLALAPATVVPGHGEPVAPDFVATQRAELAQVARLCAAVAARQLTEAEAAAAGPYPEETMRAALRRAGGVTVARR
jgi:glyoxylase-like metal-dependent hydrolase (beta-lactamase superfamily II)